MSRRDMESRFRRRRGDQFQATLAEEAAADTVGEDWLSALHDEVRAATSGWSKAKRTPGSDPPPPAFDSDDLGVALGMAIDLIEDRAGKLEEAVAEVKRACAATGEVLSALQSSGEEDESGSS